MLLLIKMSFGLLSLVQVLVMILLRNIMLLDPQKQKNECGKNGDLDLLM
nr:MAG TPA: hypothetical protein [Crassvirales sp.]